MWTAAGGPLALQLLDRHAIIRIDANLAGNLHRLCCNLQRAHVSIFDQRPRRGSGIAPPEPIEAKGSSGSITSPDPEIRKVCPLSATTSRASRLRNILSVRQSFANSTAARFRLPAYCSSLVSNRWKRLNASAVEPAKPARICPDTAAGSFSPSASARDPAVSPGRRRPSPPGRCGARKSRSWSECGRVFSSRSSSQTHTIFITSRLLTASSFHQIPIEYSAATRPQLAQMPSSTAAFQRIAVQLGCA